MTKATYKRNQLGASVQYLEAYNLMHRQQAERERERERESWPGLGLGANKATPPNPSKTMGIRHSNICVYGRHSHANHYKDHPKPGAFEVGRATLNMSHI
jgi:hypothetical protein